MSAGTLNGWLPEHYVNRGVPRQYQTRALEDRARSSNEPDRFMVLLTVPPRAREFVVDETVAIVTKYGGSYTHTMRLVIAQYVNLGQSGLRRDWTRDEFADDAVPAVAYP
jgi:hypothetical protein